MTDHEMVAAFVRSRFRPCAGGGELTADMPLFSTGVIDSFGVLELIAFLEDTFRVTIDPAMHDLMEFDTINRIVSVVDRARQASGR
jgi:acyl carrier protein